jgi:hypothetical protein
MMIRRSINPFVARLKFPRPKTPTNTLDVISSFEVHRYKSPKKMTDAAFGLDARRSWGNDRDVRRILRKKLVRAIWSSMGSWLEFGSEASWVPEQSPQGCTQAQSELRVEGLKNV